MHLQFDFAPMLPKIAENEFGVVYGWLIDAKRSTGSLLKPFLYAAAMDAGKIMPQSILPDLPLYFAGYTPKNYDLDYRGVAPGVC